MIPGQPGATGACGELGRIHPIRRAAPRLSQDPLIWPSAAALAWNLADVRPFSGAIQLLFYALNSGEVSHALG